MCRSSSQYHPASSPRPSTPPPRARLGQLPHTQMLSGSVTSSWYQQLQMLPATGAPGSQIQCSPQARATAGCWFRCPAVGIAACQWRQRLAPNAATYSRPPRAAGPGIQTLQSHAASCRQPAEGPTPPRATAYCTIDSMVVEVHVHQPPHGHLLPGWQAIPVPGSLARPFLRALSATCLHMAVHWKNVILALESVSNICLDNCVGR